MSVHPTGKFPEKGENLKGWARFPGWNFRTEFRVPFTHFLYFLPVPGPRQEDLSQPVSKSNWLPSSSCINARFGFLLVRQWRHYCTTSDPGLGLIGKYLVMSSSNIYSEVHIHALNRIPAIFLLTCFSYHLLSSDASSLDSSQSPSPYSETMTSNKLTNWEDRDVGGRNCGQ